MSHFTVTVRLSKDLLNRHSAKLVDKLGRFDAYHPAVVRSALAEILAPYNENVEEGSPYATFRDRTEELRKEYEASEEHKAEFPTFEDYVRDYAGYESTNSQGQYGYWRNENAKWDWYSIGGRWRGFFPIKAGVRAEVGEPGAFNNAPKEGSDVVRKHHLDWDKIADGAEKDFARFKDEYRRYLKGEQWGPFEGPRDELLRLGLVRVEHDPNAALAENEVQIGNEWGEEHSHIRGTDRERWRDVATVATDEQLERYRSAFNPLLTFAAVDEQGWYSPGDMGWFGMSSDTPDSYLAFADAFNEKFIKTLGDEDLLVLVDCHI